MNYELIVRSSSQQVDFALLKDGKLIELHKEAEDNKYSVGDVFISKVRKTVPGLNAAFVNVGYEKDAFLHYHDLGPKILSTLDFVKRVSTGKLRSYSLKEFPLKKEIDKNGTINNALKNNQSILVQIVKEPISTKGPRISSELSLAGRYIVLVPFSDRVSISQKIESNQEKERLKRLIKSIKPKGFGVIIRTVAEGKKVAELDRDLQNLMDRWNAMCKKLRGAHLPSKVLSELNRGASIIRDMFNDSFTAIHIDDETLYYQIKDYVQAIAPNKENIVKHYDAKVPIFEKFGIERQIKTSFGRTVSGAKGAYLVIEHTEALHVIDVNSGNRSNKSKTQEDTALEVNLLAASEVARQLRLRDMGGIIVVDFIDMAKDFNASCLNVISGVMPLKPSDAIPIVKNWIKEAEKADVKILFETHRDSLLNDLFFTIQLMDLIPEMRLCADLSHIVVDRELRLPLNDRDNEYINKVINRSDCFQGRVANREQIQIQIDFPQHAEWVEQFKSWWKIGLNDWHMRNDDDAELIFLCELGPRPYAITDGNQEELSDRWNEALIIRKWIQSFWNEIQK